MARNQIDEMDLLALVALPLFAGIELGVWSLSLDIWQGIDFAAPLASFGGVDISIAFIVTLLSIGGLAAAGSLSKGDYTQEEWYVIAGAMAIIPLHALVPLVQDLFAISDIIPFGVWLLLSGAAVFISYKA